MKVEKIVYEEMDIEITGITLISKEEYNKAKKYITWKDGSWWLRSPGNHEVEVAFVDRNGKVDEIGNYVGIRNFVRPALTIRKKPRTLHFGDKIMAAGYAWTVISEDMALCDSFIDKQVFHWKRDAKNANDYETSDVKKYLDSWWATKGDCGSESE